MIAFPSWTDVCGLNLGIDPNDNDTYSFRTDSDALIVKGLLTILEKIFTNQNVEDILKMGSQDILRSIGLEKTITSQRTNGFSSAVEKIHTIIK